MTKCNPDNERVKRAYFIFMKEAGRQNEQTVDAAAEAIARFEVYTRFRDFRAFHIDQAVGFKRHLAAQANKRTGEPLSKATLHSILAQLKRFFVWLAGRPGFRSRLRYSDAEYFNLAEKDVRVATARRESRYPTVEQVKRVLELMPATSDLERRDRALVAFTLLTGARDSAIASFKLKHVDLSADCLHQDGRDVKTKNSKTFETYFFPVGIEVRDIIGEWIAFLREDKLWTDDDPLFPATLVVVTTNHKFQAAGLKREHWRTTAPVRAVFKQAFQRAGLPYYNPHSFRKTLMALGYSLCKTPEDLKCWSQNFGHEHVATTLCSYGFVRAERQAEIIRLLANTEKATAPADEIADAVVRRLLITRMIAGNESA